MNTEEFTHLTKEQHDTLTQGRNADKLHKHEFPLGFGGGGGVSNFLGLTDTPAAYSGEAGKFVKVKSTEDGLEFDTGGVSTWLGLTDTPGSFDALKGVRANAAGNALEFYTISGGTDETAKVSSNDTTAG